MRIRPVGGAALLLELDDLWQVEAMHGELVRRRADGRLPPVDEIVPAARTILLDGLADPGSLALELAALALPPRPAAAGGPAVELRAVYDGEDLPWVAERWGMTIEEAVAVHAGSELRAAFCGFAPGFAYLVGLPERCHLPRRPSPRPRVPTGAVAVAAGFTAVYPRPSPGGWHLIGRTDAVLWDPHRPHPALLAPGTRVRFVPVDG